MWELLRLLKHGNMAASAWRSTKQPISHSQGMLEARVKILTNNTVSPVFSPQDVVSCSPLSQGCEGGFPYLVAGRYSKDYGVVAEDCNPYLGKDGTCSTKTCVK